MSTQFVSKDTLIKVIEVNGACSHKLLECTDITGRRIIHCDECSLLTMKGYMSHYNGAIKLLVERYGEEALFEVLL
jgi:hypothetical protein